MGNNYKKKTEDKKEDEKEDDDDEEELVATPSQAPALLDAPEISLEMSPLTAENPQKSFERYVKRVPPRLVTATETSWEKLQGRP